VEIAGSMQESRKGTQGRRKSRGEEKKAVGGGSKKRMGGARTGVRFLYYGKGREAKKKGKGLGTNRWGGK